MAVAREIGVDGLYAESLWTPWVWGALGIALSGLSFLALHVEVEHLLKIAFMPNAR